MIEVKGFYIMYAGDETVGMFSKEWTIDEWFCFETKEDLKAFKEKLLEAWEYCSDTPLYIETFEEREEAYRKYDEINNFFDKPGEIF